MFSCLCLAAVASAQPACAAGKKYSGYCLEQDLCMSGGNLVTVCAEAVKFESVEAGYTCVSKAPVWDVYVFRRDTRQYIQMPYISWLKVSSAFINSDRFGSAKPVSERHFEDRGQKYTVYNYPAAVTSDKSMLFQTDPGTKPRMMRGQVKCMELPVDMHPGSILEKFYGLPLLPGIPLSVSKNGDRGYSEWQVRTKKIVKNDSIAASQFDMPAGFKKVPFEHSFFFSASTKGAIDDYVGLPDK